ncbi:hypothetical protein NMG60_11012725 [Bertholletia excelsa]
MAGAAGRVPVGRRILMWESYDMGNSGESVAGLDDTVFGFLDHGGEESPDGASRWEETERVDEEDGKERKSGNVEDDKSFWENQEQELHATLCRTSSLETSIRNITKEAVKEAKEAGNFCVCRKQANGGCRNCLMTEICGRLQNAGFNSAICKSKWRNSPDIPSGEHTFLDVVDNSSPKKGEVRVIIELNFRAEFEVARASENYNRLIRRLPEVFVGKVERLQGLIKILCSAAKKCMKGNKMHMGPWRKARYMQAKWLGPCKRTTSAPAPLAAAYSTRSAPRRPQASMLTVDLLENFSGLHRTAVEVV